MPGSCGRHPHTPCTHGPCAGSQLPPERDSGHCRSARVHAFARSQPWRLWRTSVLWGGGPHLLAPRRQGIRASSESLGSRTWDRGCEVKVRTPGTGPMDTQVRCPGPGAAEGRRGLNSTELGTGGETRTARSVSPVPALPRTRPRRCLCAHSHGCSRPRPRQAPGDRPSAFPAPPPPRPRQLCLVHLDLNPYAL